MPNSYLESEKGALREIIAAKILMEQGYVISFPIGTERYDFIAEKHPFIARVQIKHLIKTREESDIHIARWFIRAFSAPNHKKKLYTVDDCDFVMAVTNDSQNFAIIPIKEVPGTGEVNITGPKSTRIKYLNSFIAFEE